MIKKSIQRKIEKIKKDASSSLTSKDVPSEAKLLIKSLLTLLDAAVALVKKK